MADLTETIYVRVRGGDFKHQLAQMSDDLGEPSVASMIRHILERELKEWKKFTQAPATREPIAVASDQGESSSDATE